jgi:hypothetical protein
VAADVVVGQGQEAEHGPGGGPLPQRDCGPAVVGGGRRRPAAPRTAGRRARACSRRRCARARPGSGGGKDVAQRDKRTSSSASAADQLHRGGEDCGLIGPDAMSPPILATLAATPRSAPAWPVRPATTCTGSRSATAVRRAPAATGNR